MATAETNRSVTLEIDLETARNLALLKQGLHRRPAAADRETLLKIVRRIGLLQLDSINVVARSHYLVMLSRAGAYDRRDLDALLYPERRLFEAWAHAACLIPVEDYPYFLPRSIARRGEALPAWLVDQIGSDPQELLDEVLEEVRLRGAVGSKDFDAGGHKSSPWWGYKPAKRALVILFDRGYLLVDRRVNFQILYDLAERVLPHGGELNHLTTRDFERWAVLKGLGHLGVATARQVSDYYRLQKPTTRTLLEEMEITREVKPVRVSDWAETGYMLAEDLPLVEELSAGKHVPQLTAFLSPFDNLIWDRERTKELFGFDYKIEVYVPKAKRVYGYYSLPILHHGRLVGRLDPKADRKTRTMIVRHLHLEPDIPLEDDLLSGIAEALAEFMRFHNSQRLDIEQADPLSLKTALLTRVDQLTG